MNCIAANQNHRCSFNASGLLLLCLAVGVIAGVAVSFTVNDLALANLCASQNDASSVMHGYWLLTFLKYYLTYQFWLTLEFVFGFGPAFPPLSFLTLMLSAFSLGVSLRGICLTDAVIVNALCSLPWKLAVLLLELCQTNNSLRLADMYLGISLTCENRIGLKREVSDYLAKFLVYSLCCAVLSALRCLIVCLCA